MMGRSRGSPRRPRHSPLLGKFENSDKSNLLFDINFNMITLGNYYSSRAEREKSISYFRRALQIDRNCLSAWTLMGHEYVELKNTHAAVISYKRAVGKIKFLNSFVLFFS